jgi:hypothetical protein
VPSNIAAQLQSLSRLRDAGPAIALPNGAVYQRGTPGKSITPSRARQQEMQQTGRNTFSSSSSSSSSSFSSPRGKSRHSPQGPYSPSEASLDQSLLMTPFSSPHKGAQAQGSGGRTSAYNGGSSNSVASSTREDYSAAAAGGGGAERSPRSPRPRSGLPVTNNMYGKGSAAELELEQSRKGKKSEFGKIVTDLNHLTRYCAKRTWK